MGSAEPPRGSTPAVLSAAQRRALVWGLVVIALLTGMGAGLATVRRIAGAFSFKRAEPVITQQIVVERLREVAKLVTVEMTMRDVVTYEQTQLRSTKRALLVVTARVAAGIDLAEDTDVRIDSIAKRIIVSLPPAQVMSVDVLEVTTYDEQAGLWNPFRAEDRDAIQRRVRTHMMTTAQGSGILVHADENAAKILKELLSRDGYSVEIRRPPVKARG
ncbi:MAG: DUF4230 domain-containing protein [Gemmatimonas sp.]